MKNKNYKISLLLCFMFSLLFFTVLIFIQYRFVMRFTVNQNKVISSIVLKVKESYPEVSEEEIIKILNQSTLENDDLLKKYGIQLEKDVVSLANQAIIRRTFLITFLVLFFFFLLMLFTISFFHYREKKKIQEITNYIKEINQQNYDLDILSNREDDLSLLKNEIYKTAVTLNEQAILLTKDKETLKDSLSDISHQLKTPLTSITLMIDTLLEGKKISEKKRKDILINSHRKIGSINFLVHSLLKLSKFDANTIIFHDDFYKIEDILALVVDNVSVISDLKNVQICIEGNKKDKIYCDFKWQVEAITNLVKNCLEYSNPTSVIDIKYLTNDLFTKIVIKDYGIGMDSYDQQHIFERFYKGKNSTTDSVGIGLSLAKMIIEKDNGYITVESKIGKGTVFTIKYLK